MAASVRVAGNTVWIKAGTYTVTSASTNIAAGCVSDATGGNTVTWEGYSSTRGDLGTAPIIKADGVITTFVLFTVTGASTAGSLIRNITLDGNSRTSSQGWSLARRTQLYKCTAQNCTNIGVTSSAAGNLLVACAATNITGGAAAFVNVNAVACEAYSNTVTGFAQTTTSGQTLTACLSYNNSGSTSDGFSFSIGTCVVVGCVAYGNGRDGFRFALETALAINCIAEAQTAGGAVGFNATSSAIGSATLLRNCAVYNNTTNISTNIPASNQIGGVTGTASFFVSSTNFALSTTAGGGALARATGYPGTFPSGTTVGYEDIGAVNSHPPPFGAPGLGGGMSG